MQSEPTVVTATPVDLPTDVPTETAAILPTPTTSSPTRTPVPTSGPDFSGVTLVETTHLMDPKHFQISLEHWPGEFHEDSRVTVDEDEYSCDILFPEQFPGRVYCWGLAPERGAEVHVRVYLPGESDPVLDIPFTVPSPGGG